MDLYKRHFHGHVVRMLVISSVLIGFLVLVVPIAHADPKKAAFTKGAGVTLTLNEDRQLKGIYLEEKDGTVWIGIDQGEVGVDREHIVSMTASPNDDTEFSARKAKLSPKDAAGHWRLAEWAKGKGLDSSAASEAEIVLALAPTHAGAHEFLGHEYYEGKWLSHDDVMKAKGFLDYRGRWVSREEFTKLEAIQLAEEAQTTRTREALTVRWRESLQQSSDYQYRIAVEAERIRHSRTERILYIRR